MTEEFPPAGHAHGAMSKRAWILFMGISVIWGTPYLMIKVAVRTMAPPVIVFGRSAIAAIVVLVLAHRADALRPALRRWRPVAAFGLLEMAAPWVLLVNAEKRLPSGLTGLLIAFVPMIGAVASFVLGDRHALHPKRLIGIVLGLGGVGLIVGRDLGGRGAIPWWSVISVLVVCVCYATAPQILPRRLADVPGLGVIALSLALVSVLYAPFAYLTRPTVMPPATGLLSVLGLGLFCTGLAFVVFFAVIREIGPSRATLITFVNPAVAVLLGVVVLDESLSAATIGGFVLVSAGCWFATRPASAATAVTARSITEPAT
jgi:drug/metabolite transporter (DMT)-like permease